MSGPGRNDLCPCGSGKKYKQCCITKQTVTRPQTQSINAWLAQAAQYLNTGNINAAVSACHQILSIKPEQADALNLLGIISFQSSNILAAVDFLKRSVKANPKDASAQNNLGTILRETREPTLAAHHIQKAILLRPDYVDAYINLGNVLQDLGRIDEALIQYQKASALAPSNTAALSNYANALQSLNNHTLAKAALKKLLDINPDHPYALGAYAFSKLHTCDWEGLGQVVATIKNGLYQGKAVCKPFEFLALSRSLEDQYLCAKNFIHQMHPALNIKKTFNYTHNKIRIAYVSADFRQHPVSQLIVGLIEGHTREIFEVIGISLGQDDHSALRTRISNGFDQFIDVTNKTDDEIVHLMHEMEIDIAIDLNGFTTNARTNIFALRAAPIQINFLGFAGTMGAEYYDYIIADNVTIPTQDEAYFSEKILRLPNSFQPNDPTRTISSDIPTRASQGLPEDAFVFCAFNNTYKITPEIFSIWLQLLNQLPKSVLWLSPTTQEAKENLYLKANTQGIDASRIIFATRTENLEDHLARHQLADLFLDTTPYNAHSTASDALSTGLPVLTVMGDTYCGRVATSLLTALNLKELITNSLDEYLNLATQLAESSEKILAIKTKLNAGLKNNDLFNQVSYVYEFETLLQNL